MVFSMSRCFREPPPNFTGLNPNEPIEIHRRNLPHWRQPGATYFVTYRLSDSLPEARAEQLREYREEWKRENPSPHTEVQLRAYAKLFSTRVEGWLDEGAGCCALGDHVNARLVDSTLRFFDGGRYHLFCSVVMPNHMHAIVKPLGENCLDEIWESWKKFSATGLAKKGVKTRPVWFSEGYDRIIRDVEHLQRVVRYIGRNPIKIGLTREETFCRICDDWIAAGWDWMDEE